jgi:hypothetical protein
MENPSPEPSSTIGTHTSVHNPKSAKLEPEVERMIADRVNATTSRVLFPHPDKPESIRKAIRQFRKRQKLGKTQPANGTIL